MINVKRSLIVVVDIVLAVYLVLAITAFNKPEEKANVCVHVDVSIPEGITEGFLTRAEVLRQLRQHGLYPEGHPMTQVDTRKIEELLATNPFVEQAQCYKTQGGHINITISQRLPVLRIIADNGDNYYLDTHGEILPFTQYASDLIVATGHIDRSYACRVLAPMACQLVSDRFWQSQVVQLNVLPDNTIELVPRVGGHVAYLGEAVDIPRKLSRLRKFYQHGLSVVGWDKYKRISVEFNNQIVCKRRGK